MVFQWLIKNRVTAGFGLALVVLVVVGIDAYLNLLNYRKSADAVEHTGMGVQFMQKAPEKDKEQPLS
ncbi:hypothetical protein [Calothrix sp. PCC 7507]|uniref:hypothetical protein n=1 Tax=Calothrix sp. PCC 7507 TaxID=99598 RepID=UPI00029EF510|nr:hypothetical protein [Calothrix sp. PCC 7507]AFY33782.1 hypothetical protein Cal7507_3381 [Calothrix sp. PCC 7507]